MSNIRVAAIAALLVCDLAAGGAVAQDQPVDQAKLQSLEAAVRTLTEESTSQRSQLQGLQGELAARDAAINAAQAEAAARDRQIEDLTRQVAEAGARARQLETDLAAARSATAAEADARRTQGDEAEAVAASAAALDIRLQEVGAALADCDLLIKNQRGELMAARNDLVADGVHLADKDRQIAALTAAARELVVGSQQLETQNDELARRLQQAGGDRQAFFDRLRETLGPGGDGQIDAERFIFPTQIAFESGSARLTPEARSATLQLGRAIAAAAAALPADSRWVLRIDGHTDQRPVAGRLFASNRSLGAARAIEVTEVLTEAGLPPERLLPASFGEYRPLEAGTTADAHQANRRVELRVDNQ